MMLTEEPAPRWIRELARFARLKPMIFLHGNIHDLVSYPQRTNNGAEPSWVTGTLSVVLRRFLRESGYELIAECDPISNLSFESRGSQEKFAAIEKSVSKTATTPGQRPQGALPPWANSLDVISAALGGTEVPCAFVAYHASRLVTSPDTVDENQRGLLLRMFKSALGSRDVVRGEQRWKNLLILVCDKLNDLPAYLLLNNPRARSIRIDPPSRADRMRFLESRWPAFYRAENAAPPSPEENLPGDFADLTEGFSNYELDSLVRLSLSEQIPVRDPTTGIPQIRQLVERFKYGVLECQWETIGDRIRQAPEVIRSSIHGQDEAVERMIEMISRAKLGLAAGESQRSNRPRGVLFFAGPTGVGKTEMAKAIASALLGDSSRLVRFDMSEFGAEHSDQRLLGAPPGYIGYDEGGELTDAVRKSPFSILLFDEIDKAHPRILDKFLQILDDGRLTDGKGETVYFSECLIIFTSNLGIVGSGQELLLDPATPYPELRETVLSRIREHFNSVLKRPEILNRLGDNFVVFDFIRPPHDERILDSLIKKFQQAAAEKRHLDVSLHSSVREQLMGHARTQLHHGGRGIRNALETALVAPLSRALFDSDVRPPAKVKVTRLTDSGEDKGCRFSVEIQVEATRDA